MATVSASQIEAFGLDIDALKIAIGPKRVLTKADGSVEIESHKLEEILALASYLKKSSGSKKKPGNSLSFARFKPGNSNGGYK